jgi:hypothetical protein
MASGFASPYPPLDGVNLADSSAALYGRKARNTAARWTGLEVPGRSTVKHRNQIVVVLCVLSVFSVACGDRRESAGDSKADEDAVRQQVAKYTQVLDAADTGIASQVWLATPEASFISPMGHSHGWEDVKKVYDFFGATFTDRKLTARDIAVYVHGDSRMWSFTGITPRSRRAMGRMSRQTVGSRRCTEGSTRGGGLWCMFIIPGCH